MSYEQIQWLRYLIFASVIIYFIYDYFDNKKIKDEREEFLKLKTFELVQKVTLFCVSVLALSYVFYPEMPAAIPIVTIVLCSLYTEVFGKLYLRRKY